MEKRNLFLVLIGFPLLYILYSLTNISKELFIGENSYYFIPFWLGIILLHWITFGVLVYFLKKEKLKLSDIGYKLNKKGTLILVLSFLIVASLALFYTEWCLSNLEIDEEMIEKLPMFFPKTFNQRLFFILVVFSAGFVEEIIYRGYLITKLKNFGLNKWVALIPSGIAFVFIHGINGFNQFFFYFIPAIIFGVIYIFSKRLLPSIILHLLIDLSAVMVVLQAIIK